MIRLVLLLAVGAVATVRGCAAGRQIISSGGISAYDRQAIVAAHNKLRQSVALGHISRQPPAANMMEMVWDDELAATAQGWADQCTTAHDGAAQREVGRFPVGQNIAATWTTRRPSTPADSKPDFNKQINAWFDEVRVYGFKPTGYGHGTGHYSQLVWGETSHVGCGFSFYYDPARGYTKLYVCNYGPGGNVIGANPYEKGSPACSNFGLSDSPKYSGLCSATYSSSSSYESGSIDNSDSYSANIIPESTGDVPSGYNAFSYNTYNQFSNQFANQFSNQYQYQNNYNQQPSDYNQQANSYSQDGTYEQPKKSYYQQSNYQTTEAATYKPFISIFKGASNLFSNAKQSIFTPKRNGFRFGTLYL